jgi:hypothetical protein
MICRGVCTSIDQMQSMNSIFAGKSLTSEQAGSSLGHFRFNFLVMLKLLCSRYKDRRTCKAHRLEGLAAPTLFQRIEMAFTIELWLNVRALLAERT